MNQLQSELRLARSLIEEKDAEMQRIRSTNNQVCLKLFWKINFWISVNAKYLVYSEMELLFFMEKCHFKRKLQLRAALLSSFAATVASLPLKMNMMYQKKSQSIWLRCRL